MPLIYLFVVILGFVLDVASMLLTLKRNRTGHGPSGLPLVPLLLYLIPSLGGHPVLSTWADVAVLVPFHVLLRYLVPYLDRRFLKRKADSALQAPHL